MKVSVLGDSGAAQQLAAALVQLDADLVGAPSASPLELARRATVDAVVIGAPLPGRFSLALESLDRGKHVLIAGTLRNPWERAVLTQRAGEQDRILQLALPSLLDSERVRLACATAELEDLRLVTARRDWDGRDWSDLWDGFADEVARLQLLLGEAPQWVSGEAREFASTEGDAEAVSFTLGYSSERMAQVQFVVGAVEAGLTAYTRSGQAKIEPAHFPPRSHSDEADASEYASELARGFLASIGSGNAGAAVAPIDVLRAVEAAQRSLAEGLGEAKISP